MGSVTDFLLAHILEDYRDPLSRGQVWALRCMPFIDVKSGLRGRELTDNRVRSVRIYLNGHYVAKAYGSRLEKRYDEKGFPGITRLYSDLERELKRAAPHGFSRVLDYNL